MEISPIENELVLKKEYSAVLYHYKADAIDTHINKKFMDNPYSIIDTRDMYKIKKGEKIKLIEIFRDGNIFKVELLTNRPKKDYYFIEIESLKYYSLLKSKNLTS